jgi:hypothetical protein
MAKRSKKNISATVKQSEFPISNKLWIKNVIPFKIRLKFQYNGHTCSISDYSYRPDLNNGNWQFMQKKKIQICILIPCNESKFSLQMWNCDLIEPVVGVQSIGWLDIVSHES